MVDTVWMDLGSEDIGVEHSEFSHPSNPPFTDQAVAKFNEASRLDPKLATAYYGRALVEMGAARWTAARDSLLAMFEHGNFGDSRLRRMLQAARENWVKVIHHIANDRASESFKESQALKAKAENVSGFPVVTTGKPIAGTLCALTKASASAAFPAIQSGNKPIPLSGSLSNDGPVNASAG